jgi:hypothetical protein
MLEILGRGCKLLVKWGRRHARDIGTGLQITSEMGTPSC